MKFTALITVGIGAATLAGAPALAQNAPAHGLDTDSRAWAQWQAAQAETVSAERMMDGDVTNGFNMLGNVTDLILDERGDRIEYALYEVPHPLSFYGSEDGFVRWGNIAIERGVGTGLDLRLDDGASPYSKEQLTLTRAEANNRMVSRIIGSELMFADGQKREIQDIQFDPDSGLITNYIVEMDEDSLFKEDTRKVPAPLVTLDQEGVWIVSQPVTYDWEVWVF